MRVYRAKVPDIAKLVIDTLCNDGDIEVTTENRSESEQDLVAIMEEYLRRDWQLREKVREDMAISGVGYENYGKMRGKLADRWGHPTRGDVGKYLSRQFIENFMISQFVEEVFTSDSHLWKKTLGLIESFHVDESELREEAKGFIKNVKEGTVEYEMAFQRSLKQVKKRRGLI
jgi:hypothetical protein